MSNGSYRHELKYYIDMGSYQELSRRLKLTMEQDKYARRHGGEYFIRSLYFDDFDDTAFRDKLDGVDARDKYRIRIYNMTEDAIKLECKHKQNNYILKNSVLLTRSECDALTGGDYSFLLKKDSDFARRMFCVFSTKRMLPRVIVDYTREAYTFPYQDVRVTFDKNVATGYRSTDLFNPDIPTYQVIDRGDMVLEIKFNAFLPTYIRSLLQLERHTRSAISKYCICRKFEL